MTADRILVPAGPSAEAIRTALDSGFTKSQLARITGLANATIHDISKPNGRQWIGPATEMSVLDVTDRIDFDLAKTLHNNHQLVRDHLHELDGIGYTNKHIADLASTTASTIQNLKSGRQSPTVPVALAILGISKHIRTRVASPLGAMRRVQALISWGHNEQRIAYEIGCTDAELAEIFAGKMNAHDADLGSRVTVAFTKLEQIPGTDEGCRLYGAEMGWPIPYQWDEYTIDRKAASIAPRCAEPATMTVEEPVEEADEFTISWDDIDTAELERWLAEPSMA